MMASSYLLKYVSLWFDTNDIKLIRPQSLNTAATVVMCLSVNTGLGHHMLYIGYNRLVEYLRVCIFLDSNVWFTDQASCTTSN